MKTTITKPKAVQKSVNYPCLMRIANAHKESCIVLFTEPTTGMVVHLESETAPWDIGTYYTCWAQEPSPAPLRDEVITLQNS